MEVCQLERLFNVMPLQDIWMCSWPRSKQEAVYRPTAGGELTDGHFGFALYILTQKFSHIWDLECSLFILQFSIDYLFNSLIGDLVFKML